MPLWPSVSDAPLALHLRCPLQPPLLRLQCPSGLASSTPPSPMPLWPSVFDAPRNLHHSIFDTPLALHLRRSPSQAPSLRLRRPSGPLSPMPLATSTTPSLTLLWPRKLHPSISDAPLALRLRRPSQPPPLHLRRPSGPPSPTLPLASSIPPSPTPLWPSVSDAPSLASSTPPTSPSGPSSRRQ